MDFPRDEMLEKYARLREKLVDPYVPDLEVAGGTTRYVKFNDAWRGTNPYSKLLSSRLENRKNTFPKVPSAKIPKNGNPDNYVTLRYDASGMLRTASLGKYNDTELVIVYASEHLAIGYDVCENPGSAPTYDLLYFEWYEYDDHGRLVSAEEFKSRGLPFENVVINCEYYEYEDDVISHIRCFTDFEKYPSELTFELVRRFVPDRIFNPSQAEYFFRPGADGLDYTYKNYYRASQTITREGHVSSETLSHLAENVRIK